MPNETDIVIERWETPADGPWKTIKREAYVAPSYLATIPGAPIGLEVVFQNQRMESPEDPPERPRYNQEAIDLTYTDKQHPLRDGQCAVVRWGAINDMLSGDGPFTHILATAAGQAGLRNIEGISGNEVEVRSKPGWYTIGGSAFKKSIKGVDKQEPAAAKSITLTFHSADRAKIDAALGARYKELTGEDIEDHIDLEKPVDGFIEVPPVRPVRQRQ